MMAKVVISEDACKSCGYCVKTCPKSVLKITDTVNKYGYSIAGMVNEDDCIGCAMCAAVCPDAAIEVYK